jgi:uroporphyrinogen III methyltransferase/synthase
VVAYENCSPAADEVELPTAVVQGRIDVFVFASPSSVRNFAELLGPDRTAELLAPPATIACIGPTTAAAVRDLGLAVDVEPDESSIPALVQAICTHSQMTRPLP